MPGARFGYPAFTITGAACTGWSGRIARLRSARHQTAPQPQCRLRRGSGVWVADRRGERRRQRSFTGSPGRCVPRGCRAGDSGWAGLNAGLTSFGFCVDGGCIYILSIVILYMRQFRDNGFRRIEPAEPRLTVYGSDAAGAVYKNGRNSSCLLPGQSSEWPPKTFRRAHARCWKGSACTAL